MECYTNAPRSVSFRLAMKRAWRSGSALMLSLLGACVEAQPTLPRRDASADGADASGADARDDRPTAPMSDGSDVTDAQDVQSALDVIDDRPSSAMTDGAADAPREASATDAADAATDSGAPPARCTPTIDGTINASEYTAAIRAENSTLPSAWGPNELRELFLCYDDRALYLAVRGSVETAPMGSPANAIVLYIDRDFRGGTGGSATGISLFSALTDRTGALDTALSSDFRLGASVDGFGIEGAFGISGMRTLTSASSDEGQGWRLFWPATAMPDRRANFAYIVTGVSTNCQDRAGTADDVCETSVAWTSLFEAPRPASTTIALFARIVNGGGTMSPDQTLPYDMPSTPRTITRVLTMDVR